MGSVLYLDIFFINNLIMDLLVVLSAVRLSRRPVRLLNCILAALAGSVYSCLEILLIRQYLKIPVIRYLLTLVVMSFLMALICWYKCGWYECIRGMCFLYIASFIISGILMLLEGYLKQKWILLFATISTTVFSMDVLQKKRSFENALVTVILSHHGRQKTYIGMWDTGNGLLDPIMKEPVHVMAKEDITYFFKNGLEDEKIRLIPYHSVGKPGGVMMAVVIDKMVIREQGKNDEIHTDVVMAMSEHAFPKHLPYRLILNPLVKAD